MTESRHRTRARIPGTILLVGEDAADLGRALEALRPLADVTLVPCHAAGATLARLQVDVLVTDDEDDAPAVRALLAEGAMLAPAATRILLVRREVAAEDLEPDVTVLTKPVDPAALVALCTLALRNAAAHRIARDLERENRRLRGTDSDPPAYGLEELGTLERYEGLLTRGVMMRSVTALLYRIEEGDGPVLIRGETGTGKELVAQAIHARSRRRERRFVAVNLGALSDSFRESELFGYVRGVFPGTGEDRTGRLLAADGGAVFLDEIGDASPALQGALLRLLDEGTVTPLGADGARPLDVRLLAGTKRNLEELVRHGLFRRDLYDRLRGFCVDLPALRERPEDVFPLARHHLAIASTAMGHKPPGISREARAVLEGYSWPGNVRELRNVIERAAILCKSGLVIAADLPIVWRGAAAPGADHGVASTIAIPAGGASLKQLEREIFVRTLALAGGNQSRAASILGLRESTFRFRLRKLGIASRRAPVATPQPTATQQLVARG